ncbi:MAG TPA: hypothetical protein VMH40_15385 [Myxococcaceae bacterium]|nr:hypothetical protein [Myxococcaceae bacterium]
MRPLLLASVVLWGCSSGPDLVQPPPIDQVCFVPADGGVFVNGFPLPIPGCASRSGDAGVLDLRTEGLWAKGGVLVVPPVDAGVALPVVVVFHGAGGFGTFIRQDFQLEGPADGGAIFVYPNALQGTWDIGPSSADGLALDRLLGELARRYCIDPGQIDLAGFSAGAVFTLYMACNEGPTFRAVASVAGTSDRFDTACCKAPVSTILIHGTQDPTIDFPSGLATRDDVRQRNHCGTTSSPDSAECVTYAGCSKPLDWCVWDGMHEVPAWAGAEAWRFFSAAP